MFDNLNRNEGVLAVIGTVIALIAYLFTNKLIGVLVFISFLAIFFGFHYYLKKKVKSFDEIQKTAKILFIDDKDCQVVTSLRRNNFDVRKIDDVAYPATDSNVQWANIIFVDYKDVGKKLFGRKEGLGLINELRRIYTNKKRYIIYSTVQDFGGLLEFSFIRKNASYDEYVSIISVEASKL